MADRFSGLQSNFLYVLKSNGAVWRISNPRNPDDNLLLKGTDEGDRQISLRQEYAAAAREATSQ